MIVFGGLVAMLGALLFHRALGMVLRANHSSKIPFWRSAKVMPLGARSLRALGIGLLVLGALLLGTTGWQGPIIVVLVGPVAALFVIAAHNRRVQRRLSTSGIPLALARQEPEK